MVSHPLLRGAAVVVCPPLFPAGSGSSSTLEVTDKKCLKTTPVSPSHIFCVCAVSSRHGATRITKGWWKAHIFHKACWEIITAGLLPFHVAAISVKQLDILIPWFLFSGQTDRVLEDKGDFQMWGHKTKQQQLSCRSHIFHSVAQNERSEVLLWRGMVTSVNVAGTKSIYQEYVFHAEVKKVYFYFQTSWFWLIW